MIRQCVLAVLGLFLCGLALVLSDVCLAAFGAGVSLEPSSNLFAALAALVGGLAVVGLLASTPVGVGGALLLARFRRTALRRINIVLLSCGALACAATLAATALAFARARTTVPASPARSQVANGSPNIVLVVMDSLRQDALEREDSATLAPNVFELKSQATTYSQCQAASSWTRPSMSSILTGQYAVSLGTHHGHLPKSAVTIAERLRRAGYETVGFSDNRAASPTWGFDQGHDLFWHKNDAGVVGRMYIPRFFPEWLYYAFQRRFRLLYRGADYINSRVSQWITDRRDDRPFYLMIHYMDTHYPYLVYPDEPENVSNRADPDAFVAWYHLLLNSRGRPKPPFADLSLPAASLESLRLRYLGGMQHLDRCLGELVDSLKHAGEWDNTLFILTADHGEEFLEHAYWGHGSAMYQESIHVPLVVKGPHQQEALRVDAPVSLLQIAPTVILSSRTDPGAVFPMPPLPHSEAGAEPVVFSENDHHGAAIYSARAGRSQLLYSLAPDGRELRELYDVVADPAEQVNLFALFGLGVTPPDDVLRSFEDFIAWARGADRNDQAPSADDLDVLRTLGYVD